MPDLSLLYTRPTTRRSSRPDMVDLFIPAPGGGSYSIANYVRAEHADAIIAAINQREQLFELLSDVIDDLIIDQPSTPAIVAARRYLSLRT